MQKRNVSVGYRFNRLVVVREVEKRNGQRMFECVCDCGKIGSYYLCNLSKKNHSTSCGCFLLQRLKETFITHGMTKTPFYTKWTNIKTRCTNKNLYNFNDYGGRGIINEWKSFEEFKKDMYDSYKLHIKKFGRKNTSIDRIDNNGNYCKQNCRWATNKEQGNNRRDNVLHKFNGEVHNIKEWGEIIGIDSRTLSSRINGSKWDIEKVLTTPKMKNQFG